MLKQWGPTAGRFRIGPRGHAVGVIPVGTILYIQDGFRPFPSFLEPSIRRSPWIVEAWLNRKYHPATRGWPKTMYIRGGHLAIVRCLRTGRRKTVADWLLLRCLDADLEWRLAG